MGDVFRALRLRDMAAISEALRRSPTSVPSLRDEVRGGRFSFRGVAAIRRATLLQSSALVRTLTMLFFLCGGCARAAPPPLARAQDGRTPLLFACEVGFVAAVVQLLPVSDPTARDAGGRTPLLAAAGGGHVAVLEFLLAVDHDQSAALAAVTLVRAA